MILQNIARFSDGKQLVLFCSFYKYALNAQKCRDFTLIKKDFVRKKLLAHSIVPTYCTL